MNAVSKARKLADIQDRTYNEMKEILLDYSMCNVVRPTGFGKTYLISRYCEEHGDSTFLYIYDTEHNRNNFINKYNPHNIQFISYAYLSNLNGNEISEYISEVMMADYMGIIFDESHLIGGEKVENVFYELRNTGLFQIIGASANGYRMDGKDIGIEYFNGHEVFEYTMVDAVLDEIIKPPLYTVGIPEEILNDPINYDLLGDESYKMIQECSNKGEILRDTLDEAYNKVLPRYMRFIMFFSTTTEVDKVDSGLDDSILKQMTSNFPGYKINIIKITSKHKYGIDELQELEDKEVPKRKEIDFICSCNMLNQGIHMSNLTGLLFCRKTQSDIVFTQQFGRAVSVNSDNQTIIIDYVSNYNNLKRLGKRVHIDGDLSKIRKPHTSDINDLIRVCKVMMSRKQLEVLEILDRFTIMRNVENTIGIKTVVTAYVKCGMTLESFIDAQKKKGIDVEIADVARVLARKDILREEDHKYLNI